METTLAGGLHWLCIGIVWVYSLMMTLRTWVWPSS